MLIKKQIYINNWLIKEQMASKRAKMHKWLTELVKKRIHINSDIHSHIVITPF